MPKVFYSHPDGAVSAVDANPGDSVMATAVRNGVSGILGQCGGVLSCATCHVFVNDAELSDLAELDELEDEMLDCAATDRTDCSRLSCQIVVGDHDVHVTVPEAQL